MAQLSALSNSMSDILRLITHSWSKKAQLRLKKKNNLEIRIAAKRPIYSNTKYELNAK